MKPTRKVISKTTRQQLKTAFTLIELLVVIAIIAILAGINIGQMVQAFVQRQPRKGISLS